MTWLQTLKLEGNHILNLPESMLTPTKKNKKIVYTPPTQIFSFMTELQEGKEPCFRLKLMLLGKVNVCTPEKPTTFKFRNTRLIV